jgi:hypothetical protein
MKAYRLLIIAWYVGIDHVSEFIRNLKKANPSVEICLLSSKPGLEAIPEDVIKNTSEIICFKYYSGKVKSKLVAECVNRFYFLRTFIRASRRKYDIVDIHFPKSRLFFVLRWIKKLSNNLVITPWGSDVFRVDGKKSIRHLTKIYEQADFVTVGKDTPMGQRIIEKFNVNPNKFVKLGWGGEFFDYIQENSCGVNVEEAKTRFGVNGRYVITCGYNAQTAQRHFEIIDAINNVRSQLPNDITLLFPFTYGRTARSVLYCENVKNKAKECRLDFVAVEEHLDMPDLLKLRMATDIFVHVQTTDARSRCVMEYVACNKKVVHGSWMQYAYLEDYKPSCYFPVDRMENLGECVVKAYNSQVRALPEEVKGVIAERGWKHQMPLWNSFFESLV